MPELKTGKTSGIDGEGMKWNHSYGGFLGMIGNMKTPAVTSLLPPCIIGSPDNRTLAGGMSAPGMTYRPIYPGVKTPEDN